MGGKWDETQTRACWYAPVPRTPNCEGWAAVAQRVSEGQRHILLRKRSGLDWRVPHRWRTPEPLYRYGLAV